MRRNWALPFLIFLGGGCKEERQGGSEERKRVNRRSGREGDTEEEVNRTEGMGERDCSREGGTCKTNSVPTPLHHSPSSFPLNFAPLHRSLSTSLPFIVPSQLRSPSSFPLNFLKGQFEPSQLPCSLNQQSAQFRFC